MTAIREDLQTEICGDYEVIVLGGGVAGISAALAASRQGCRVLLLEKMTFLGGLATAGHVVIYLPLCDGYGRQVIGGIGEELLHLSLRYSYGEDLINWKEDGRRYETKFNGPAFALALEELLLSENVKIMYDTVFAAPVMEEGRCRAVIIENKSGRRAYTCRALVDASGDAEAFFKAGAQCASGENSLTFWAYSTSASSYSLNRGSAPEKGLYLLTIGNIDVKARRHVVTKPYSGDTAEGVNRFLLDSHGSALQELKNDPGLVLASLPSMPQFRVIRRIKGVYTITEADMGSHFEDCIGCSGDWRRPAPVYEIPYRALYAEGISNMLAAGRCISAEGDAWDVLRVIPPAAMTGEAAGLSAAWIAKEGCAARSINVNRLRRILSENGNILDINT